MLQAVSGSISFERKTLRLDSVTKLKEEEEAEKSYVGSDCGEEYSKKFDVAPFKFHFDDIYFAHVVFYLQEDEIDAEGHMCRKPEESCLNFFFDMRMNIFLASLCLQFKVEWYQRE